MTFLNTEFINSSYDFGGGIYSGASNLLFEGYSLFHSNNASMGGALHLLQGTVTFNGITTFTHNTATTKGGAVYAFRTEINIPHEINFTSNSAQTGGAVYLDGFAYLNINLNTTLNFAFNRALDYGGGIYHVDITDPLQCQQDQNSAGALHCCIKLGTRQVRINEWNISSISSYQDFAGTDGSFLYGGLLDRCFVQFYNSEHNTNVWTMYDFLMNTSILAITENDTKNVQELTSKPYTLCYCNGLNQHQDCSDSKSVLIHRGQRFVLHVIALAQGNRTVSTSITASTSSNSSLRLQQNPQNLPQTCTGLTYNLYSTQEREELILFPEGPCHDTGSARVVFNVKLRPCPDGFIQQSDGHCVCDERLQDYNVSCTIDEDVYLTKNAGSEFWMGVEYQNRTYEGLILYDTCPTGYCRTDQVIMTSLYELDAQCAQGRVGILCGACAENNSLVFGSSKCKHCFNTYLALIPAFATAGIVLIVFLSVLRLTVATGMINSVILYANIVQVNKRAFFPANASNVLTVFIAWLNLDLGFETCFYNGMDAFAQICLQFAFPVYVWVLIGMIIVTSRHSITLSKLIGHNPVAVLATLLLMSYTKVLNIIIDVFSSVQLDYPNNKTVNVWLKDANEPYLQSRHLALTVVTSLVLAFLFLPYTFLLLLGHKVYQFSGRRRFNWLNRLKPLLDSYYAPYKTRTRYWTGFLLLVRCVLYVVISLGSTHVSLLAIIATFSTLGFAVGFLVPGRIYKNFAANVLEASIYLNLVTLSAVTLGQIPHKKELVCALKGVVFATTMGVVLYHIHVKYITKCAAFMKIKAKIQSKLWKPTAQTATDLLRVVDNGASSHDPHKIISKTVVSLREPLLEEEYKGYNTIN